MKELYLYFFNRVKRDSIGLEASALSFTSILALIPAISVCFYIFAVFPSFEDVRESLKVFTKENFMPVFAETLGNYVGTFVEHSGKLTVTSIRQRNHTITESEYLAHHLPNQKDITKTKK